MRKLILGTAGAAVLALSFAQPAAAENRPQDAFLPILLGIGLIALAEKKSKKKEKTAVQPVHKPKTVEIPRTPRHPETRRHRKVLPAACYRRVKTPKGPRGVFGGRCLKENYRYYAALPDVCRTKVRNRRGRIVKGSSANCLRKHGYRMSSR